jgi:hypothetical protein
MSTNKPFYLAGTQGEGTRIWVAPVPCSLIAPQSGTFTVATGGADAGDTSIPITAATFLTRPEVTSPFLLFKDSVTGEETLVEVDGNITAGATSITVKALPKNITAASTAVWPTKLGGRSTVNNSSEDDETELENFDNDGWRDYAKTSLGQTITTTGMFMNLDAGYMNVKKARLQYQVGAPGKVFLKVAYPTPTCPGDTAYTSGFIYSGIANITSDPIESSSKGIIMGNIDFKYCGIVTVTFNGSPLVVTV